VFSVLLCMFTNVIIRVFFLVFLKEFVSICLRFRVQFHCLVEDLILIGL